MKVWRRIDDARRAWLKRRRDAAAEQLVIEHELAAQRGGNERTPIPGMRHNPDFQGHQGGL